MKLFNNLTEELRVCDNADSVFQVIRRYGKRFGFEYSAFGQVGSNPSADSATVKHYGMVDYPDTWVEEYEVNELFRTDPIVQRAHEIDDTFLWSDIASAPDLSREEKSVLTGAAEHGLKNGIAIPLHGRSGKPGLMCFAKAEGKAISRAEANEAHAMALLCFSRLDKFLMDRNAVDTLSKRQVECLYWTAMGMSSREIADLLELKESTVTYHIKVAMSHLGTNNRTVAVLKCISAGAFHIG